MGQKPRTDIRTDRQADRHSWFHSKCKLKRSKGPVDIKFTKFGEQISMDMKSRPDRQTDRHTKNNTASASAGCNNCTWNHGITDKSDDLTIMPPGHPRQTAALHAPNAHLTPLLVGDASCRLWKFFISRYHLSNSFSHFRWAWRGTSCADVHRPRFRLSATTSGDVTSGVRWAWHGGRSRRVGKVGSRRGSGTHLVIVEPSYLQSTTPSQYFAPVPAGRGEIARPKQFDKRLHRHPSHRRMDSSAACASCGRKWAAFAADNCRQVRYIHSPHHIVVPTQDCNKKWLAHVTLKFAISREGSGPRPHLIYMASWAHIRV